MNAQLYSSIQTQNLKIANEILKENGGVFKKFEYIPDDYDLSKISKRDEQLTSQEKIMKIHGKEFNNAKVKTNLKYDNPFLAKGEKLTYSFLSDGDPYQQLNNEAMRNRWIEEAKLLYGDFVPSGASKPIQTIQRSKLGDIVEVIKKLLLNDWNDVNFVIGTNPKDFIEVKFDQESLEKPQALKSYMNTLVNSNDDLLEYKIKKVSFYWDYHEGNYIYYMFSPPWIRLIVNDVVNQSNIKTVNPRIQKAIIGEPMGFNAVTKRP